MLVRPCIILILYLLFFSFLPLVSQNRIIQGNIKIDKDENIDIYQLDLYKLGNDTVFFGSYQLDKPTFRVTTSFPDCVRISISSFGSNSFVIDTCFVNDIIDLENINLTKKDFMLSEVTINYTKPRTIIEGSVTTTNVKNSFLAYMGDANNVIERLPGVIKKDGQFLILGRDRSTPAIYIDDRLIMDNSELSLLKSQYISQISIDRNPSSIYDSNTRSVIRIKTIPYFKDMFDLQINDDLSFKRKVSNYSSAQINFKKRKLATRFTYAYGVGGAKIRENSYKDIYHPQYIFNNKLSSAMNNSVYSHNIAGMANITLNSKSYLGLQYSGNFVSDKTHFSRNQQFGKNNLLDDLRYINQKSDTDQNQHLLNASYSYKKNDKTQLLLISDYVVKNIKTKNDIVEEDPINKNTSFVNYNSDNKYSIFTTSLSYKFEPFEEFKTNLGGRYAYTNNKTNTHYLLQNNNSRYKLTDHIVGLYLEVEKTFNKTTLKGGIRYEYNPVKFKTNEQGSITIQKRHLSNFLPSLQLSQQINDNIQLELNLSRKLTRPSFYDMNPIENYNDSLSIVKGSPYIKPTIADNISLYITFWNKLSIELGYTRNKNEVIQTSILENENSEKTIMVPINLKKTNYYNFSVSYALNFNSWSANIMGMLDIPDFSIMENNQKFKYNKPKYTFMINGSYSLTKSISVFSDFYISSSGYNSITYQHSINTLNVGISGNFINEKLNVRIAGTDLFQGSNWNRWNERFLNIYSGNWGTNDTRGLEISLSYRFNNIKSNVNTHRGNYDIVDRALK